MKPEGEGWMLNVGVRPAIVEKYVNVVLRNGERLVLLSIVSRWSFGVPGRDMLERDIIWWKPLDTEEERK